MSLFPFYHEYDKESLDKSDITKQEKNDMAQDMELAKYMVDYRASTGWEKDAKRGMRVNNVTQTMSRTDEISRIYLGYLRMMIDKGIEQISEGEPDFNFDPRGPTDGLKVVIWKHMIRGILSQCNYRMHQEQGFRDLFCMGSFVFEIYCDYPQRTIRLPQIDGTYQEITERDWRRPKVGVRVVNPMDCWRFPDVSDTTQVPICMKKKYITWNQFAQDYGRSDKGYKNLKKIPLGSHVCITEIQNDLGDVLRRYALSYGSDATAQASKPDASMLGIPIFDKTLKIKEKVENGVVSRSEGLNVTGSCTLRWGTYADAYDKDLSGQHSVYGMGLPKRLEAEDIVMQTIFNVNLDNYRWANTVALNYKGNSSKNYIDLNANRLYGGEVIDGEITPMPLGIARIGDTAEMMEMVDRFSVPSTGINPQQMVGDTSKTAFEFAQRIKMGTRSAEQRLSRLEAEVFKPMGELLLSASLSELTVEEYETMTEQQVDKARINIKDGKATALDYKDLHGSKPERRVHKYIKIEGEKIREDFSTTKNRKVDYNSTDNTLIRDPKMKENVSYIPLTEENVFPASYVERGLLPDVLVDSKRMLGDLKAQDHQNFQAATSFLLELKKAFGNQYQSKLDLNKVEQETIRFAGIDPKTIMKEEEQGSEILSKAKTMLDELKNPLQEQIFSPPSNAPLSQSLPPKPNAGESNAVPGGRGTPQTSLERVATGNL